MAEYITVYYGKLGENSCRRDPKDQKKEAWILLQAGA